MKFKKSLIIIFLIICNNNDYAVTQAQALRVHEPEVTLESAEQHSETFKIPESIAYQSPVIKKAITKSEKVGEPVRFIKFDDISKINLKIFIEAMEVMRNAYDKTPNINKRDLEALLEEHVEFPEEVSLDVLKEMITQAAYLSLKPLIPVIARFFARGLHDGDMTKEDIIIGIPEELIAEIARQYYLLYNEFIEGINIPYGVSVRELLDLDRLPEIPEYLEYDLSELKINDLDGLADIPDINKAKALNLSYNVLEKIKQGDFIGLGNLERLDLSHNSLKKLPPKVFKGLGSLEQLIVSHNMIAEIEPDAFNGLGSLKKLNISSNKISSLADQLFAGLGNLELLDISINSLESLSYKSFKDMVALKELNLQDNMLKKLGVKVFVELTNLTTLKLGFNQLQELAPKSFIGLEKLKYLDLSVNRIPDLPREVFHPLKNITKLNLSNNILASLDVYLFKGLLELEELDISNNKLKYSDLETGVFSGPKNLEVLRVSYNELKNIPPELFNSLPLLRRLYVIGNPVPPQIIAQLGYKYKNVDIIFWELYPAVQVEPEKCTNCCKCLRVAFDNF